MLLNLGVNQVIFDRCAIERQIDNHFIKEFSKVGNPSFEVSDFAADWRPNQNKNDVGGLIQTFSRPINVIFIILLIVDHCYGPTYT